MLETSVLINECYLKFSRAGRLAINDRAHFLAYAVRAIVQSSSTSRVGDCVSAAAGTQCT